MKGRGGMSFIDIRATFLLWSCAVASATGFLSGLIPQGRLPELHWVLESFGHWQWVYLVCGLACLIVLAFCGRIWRSIAPVLVLSGSFFSTSDGLPSAQLFTDEEPILTVVSANINFTTTEFDKLNQWLLTAKPDLAIFQEYTEQAHKALATQELREQFPYRFEVPQYDQFGLAVLSRLPIADAQQIYPKDLKETLRLRASVVWGDKTVFLSVLHPMPPFDSGYLETRDRALVEETDYLMQAGEWALMAGDFNMTPWARGMSAVEGLLRRASGLSGSWPNAFGWLSVLPIDHVLASSGWRLVDADLGPDLGTDHRPVIVRLIAQ